jgi:hypothetical protein
VSIASLPTTAFVAAPLIGRAISHRFAPAVSAAAAQRAPVLARPSHVAQQLSLFGPPGGRR